MEPRSTSSGSNSRDRPLEPPRPDPLPVTASKGKHNVSTHFPKDPNCETRKRGEISRAAGRHNSHCHIPCATKFGEIITDDHKDLNEERASRSNHRNAIVVQCKIRPLNGFKVTHAKQKLHKTLREIYVRFSKPAASPKVIHTDNSLEFGKLVKIVNGTIVPLHLIGLRRLELQKEQYEESKRALRLFYFSPDSMNSGGQNLWKFYGY